ncbi:hypothetical protein Ac2012v2_001327 [Leucoagaricus gongylophorus]
MSGPTRLVPRRPSSLAIPADSHEPQRLSDESIAKAVVWRLLCDHVTPDINRDEILMLTHEVAAYAHKADCFKHIRDRLTARRANPDQPRHQDSEERLVQ